MNDYKGKGLNPGYFCLAEMPGVIFCLSGWKKEVISKHFSG
jgi:hypothetical protein